jgi:uncharacterized phage infection (PIP) family protein YhgE
MSQKIDWEILDPQLKTQINNLNENIINLTNENKNLKDNFNSMKEENKKILEQLEHLNETFSNMKKLNIEYSLMVNQIKDFLKIGRKQYLDSFEKINNKINNLENSYDNKLSKIEENINKHTDNIFDPNYRMRMNNIRWRETSNKDYINNPI